MTLTFYIMYIATLVMEDQAIAIILLSYKYVATSIAMLWADIIPTKVKMQIIPQAKIF